MLGNPGGTKPSGGFVQTILAKPILLSQRGEGGLPCLLMGARDGAGCLPGGISSHLLQAALPLGEQRVVELSAGFQVRTQPFGLCWIYDQGQFEQKRGRLLFWLLGFFRALCPFCCHLPRLLLLLVERAFQV